MMSSLEAAQAAPLVEDDLPLVLSVIAFAISLLALVLSVPL